MSSQGCIVLFALYISGIHTIPKPLDTVEVNLNIDGGKGDGGYDGGKVDGGKGDGQGYEEKGYAGYYGEKGYGGYDGEDSAAGNYYM